MNTRPPLGLLILLVLLVLLPCSASGQDQPPSLAGRWQVVYFDRILGTVNGVARVNKEESEAELTLVHPVTGREARLRSSGITRAGDAVTIVFRGKGIGVESYRLPPLGQPVRSNGGVLKVQFGEETTELPIRSGEPAEIDEVTVELAFADAEHLAGTWRYRAEADGGRDGGGGGRLGQYALAEDGSGTAEQSGPEFWARPRPEVHAAVPIVDQLAAPYGNIAWPYPYRSGGGVTNAADARRVLMVIGKNLPSARDDAATLESLDPKIKYYLRAIKPDFAGGPQYQEEIRAGWEKLKNALTEEQFGVAQKLEVVLLEARLEPGVRPGKAGFTLNGAEATWLLQFGDFTTSFEIVRQVAPYKFEATNVVFRPEWIRLELRASRDLPFDEIPLLIGRNGDVQRLGEKRALMARRVADEPRVYRTDPIALVDPRRPLPEGTLQLKVEAGDTITAEIGELGLVDLRPHLARAKVLNTPADATGAALEKPGVQGLIWKEALTIAARCAGQPVRDWDTLARDKAKTIWNLVIFTTKEHIKETRISLGDHAAMLMLRQTFLEMMAVEEQQYARLLDGNDDGILGFHREFAPYAFRDDVPLTKVKVTAPDGAPVGLSRTYLPDLIRESYGLEGKAAKDWIVTATRAALGKFLESIRYSKKKAEEVAECKIEDLLELTGFGFDAVAGTLQSRLMRLEEVGVPARLEWRPDDLARQRVARLNLLAEAVRVQRDLAHIDTEIGLVVLSMVTLPVTLVESPLIVAYVTLAVDATDFAYTVVHEIPPLIANRAEVKFARGAAAVLGLGRLQEAELRETEQWFNSAVAVLGSGLGLGASGYGTWRALKHAESVARGKELIKSGVDPERIAELPAAARRDALAAIEDVSHLEKRIGRAALEETESTVLKFRDQLEETWSLSRSRKPDWAQGLDDRTYARIDEMRFRGDVAKLVKQNPARMRELINDEAARKVLFGEPFESLAAFERAVVEARKQKRGTLGEPFFEAADARHGDPDGALFVERPLSTEEGKAVYTAEVYSGADRPIAEITTKLEGATGGGETLVFGLVRRSPNAPKWVKQADVALDIEKGTPLTYYMNLRAMNALGVRYGDPRILVVRLDNVLNANTCIQLNWLQRAYPGLGKDVLVKFTDLYRYSENLLALAGYRIRRARVFDPDVAVTYESAGRMVMGRSKEGAVTPGRFFEGDDPMGFLRRYGVDPSERVKQSFDIDLEVEPIH